MTPLCITRAVSQRFQTPLLWRCGCLRDSSLAEWGAAPAPASARAPWLIDCCCSAQPRPRPHRGLGGELHDDGTRMTQWFLQPGWREPCKRPVLAHCPCQGAPSSALPVPSTASDGQGVAGQQDMSGRTQLHGRSNAVRRPTVCAVQHPGVRGSRSLVVGRSQRGRTGVAEDEQRSHLPMPTVVPGRVSKHMASQRPSV